MAGFYLWMVEGEGGNYVWIGKKTKGLEEIQGVGAVRKGESWEDMDRDVPRRERGGGRN